MHNSRTTCPICAKQILFERAMTGLSCDQPTKTFSLWVFAFKFLYYRRLNHRGWRSLVTYCYSWWFLQLSLLPKIFSNSILKFHHGLLKAMIPLPVYWLDLCITKFQICKTLCPMGSTLFRNPETLIAHLLHLDCCSLGLTRFLICRPLGISV